MPPGQGSLLIFFLLGVLTGNKILSSAAGILLILQIMNLERLFVVLENRAIDLGLLFLTIAILVPFTSGRIQLRNLINFILSPAGMVTFLGGAVAAILNARGVNLLRLEPEIIGAIIIGSLTSIAFFGGIPVGPVMAAGICSVFLQAFSYFF